MKTYCTTFCNRAHRLSDGKPVAHECYILNPKALQLEREGQFHLIGASTRGDPGELAPHSAVPIHFGRTMCGVRS